MMDVDCEKLECYIVWFLNEKCFIGCDGFKFNDVMKLIVVVDVCVLVFNKLWLLYCNVKEIFLYLSVYYVL